MEKGSKQTRKEGRNRINKLKRRRRERIYWKSRFTRKERASRKTS